MFLCEKCLKKYNVDEFQSLFAPRSKGPCEGCNEYAVCSDVHHSHVPEPKQKADQTDVDKLMKKIGY